MRKITFLLTLFLSLGLYTSAQENLVKNPSFEDGFTDWKKGPSSKYAEPEIKSDGGQDGAKYAHYASTKSTTGFYQDIAITPGKTYKLSFWYKATGDDTDARIWSFLMDENNKYLTTKADEDPLKNNNGYLAPATEWTRHEVTFTAPASIVKLRLGVRAYDKSTAVSYDNFSLVEDAGSEVQPSVVVNPTVMSFSSKVGTATEAQSVVVTATNLLDAPTYTISGEDAAMFTATGDLTVDGGTINIVFNPTSSGTKSGVLSITAGDTQKTVTLTGTATDASNPYGLNDSSPVTTLLENFEGEFPTGWSNVAKTGDLKWEMKSYKGAKYAQMSAFKGKGVYETLLISPAINFDGLSKKEMKFDWKSGHTNGAMLKVYAMDKTGGNKVELKTINDDSNPKGYGKNFNTETIDLSAVSGVKFIVFEYNGDADNGKTTTYQVDNIKVPSDATGVVNLKFEGLSIATQNGKVMFNAKANELIEVFNIAGQKIINRLSTEGLNQIYIPTRGIVIVKIGKRVSKVVL